jgi:hypothetical protein
VTIGSVAQIIKGRDPGKGPVMHKLLLVIFGLMTILPFAHAHPPPAACYAAQELARFRGWFQAQAGPLGWCRELGDGRVVDVRISHSAKRSRNLMRASTIPPPTSLFCVRPTRTVIHRLVEPARAG